MTIAVFVSIKKWKREASPFEIFFRGTFLRARPILAAYTAMGKLAGNSNGGTSGGGTTHLGGGPEGPAGGGGIG